MTAVSTTKNTANDVTTLVIDDPGTGRRLDAEQRDRLGAALKSAARESAPVVVLHVEGDAWAHRALDDDPADQHTLVKRVYAGPHPVVVHVSGEVSELGLALLLAADVRILGPDATISFSASAPQSLLAAGVSALVRHRGLSAAEDLLWTGAALDAAQATARGLSTEVAVVDRALDLATALSRTPHATSALHRSLRAEGSAELAERLEYDAWSAVVAAKDAR
jgi:enoyl-CoA hydratase/carnithine racemase